MDVFGCCSRYEKCSNLGMCLFQTDKEYEGCSYRKNLDNGKTFYGKNVGKTTKKYQTPNKIYVYCYNRAFLVSTKNPNGFSYKTEAETVQKLVDFFAKNNIPHKNEIDDKDAIIDGTDAEPANSQVNFEALDQTFVIKNFNMYLIKSKHAKGIVNSLNQKGIKAKIEIKGKISGGLAEKSHQIIKNENKEEKNESIHIQQSLFETA